MIIKTENEYAAVLVQTSTHYLALADNGDMFSVHKDAAAVVDDPLRQKALNTAYALEGDDDLEEMASQYTYIIQKWLKRIKSAGKTCKQCNEFKPLSAFGRRMDAADGLMHICKGCNAENNAKKYIARHKD